MHLKAQINILDMKFCQKQERRNFSPAKIFPKGIPLMQRVVCTAKLSVKCPHLSLISAKSAALTSPFLPHLSQLGHDYFTFTSFHSLIRNSFETDSKFVLYMDKYRVTSPLISAVSCCINTYHHFQNTQVT